MHYVPAHVTTSSTYMNCVLLLIALLALLSPTPAYAAAPEGTWERGNFTESEIFPGTTRGYSVYIPKQYSSDKPANLMVFMDGKNYARPDGAFKTPLVFDQLIAAGKMPVTVAVFVDPGTIEAAIAGGKNRSNRSFEYDTLGNRYSKFLLNEFLPKVTGHLNISEDPSRRAVCGISSGGICAFTVAWESPEQFGKVLSHIGSYTNIRGGWEYPGLIRKTKSAPKPIKVYLQEGNDDLNNLHGNWPLANRDMAAALQFAGYTYKLEMTEGGHSGKWGGKTFKDALTWLWNDNATATKVEIVQTKPKWTPHPDAVANPSVPQGKVIPMPQWESKIFKNTIRDWAIYVPAQYDPKQPVSLMVFQDGERMRKLDGRWRIPTVFDNLIARGEMPPTIGVFINPGHDQSKPRKGNKHSNRGFEYDSLGDRYARFLLDEIIPTVESQYSISKDPQQRAIGGSSSGAICAFTVAWEHPDQFGKVFSSVGSFTHLRGGNVYPALVRKTERKPIRVYMADTSGDVDNAFGSWWWANNRMASALKYMGYDIRFDFAEGYGHNADFGGARFPEAMKWLWRDEVHQPQINTEDDLKGDLTLLNLLIEGEDWEPVVTELGFADATCSDKAGNFYFSDMKEPAIYRISASTGARSKLAAESVSGMEFGKDGLIYACQGAKDRVISIDPKSGEVREVCSGVKPNDLSVSSSGDLFITETRTKRVTRINPKSGEKTVVDTGITRPNGIVFSPDGGTLAVSDSGGDACYTFRIAPSGSLDAKMPTMPMRLPIDPEGEFRFNETPPYKKASRGDGMAMDRRGRFYVTSAIGVQVFDPTSRPCGVISKPDPDQPLTSCVLAGKDRSYLYVTNGTAIYRRKLSIE